jgi:hypothetical protein
LRMSKIINRRSFVAQSKSIARAGALGKSESEPLRDLVDREINIPTVAERAGSLIGCLTLDSKRIDSDPWRKAIRQNNWRE